MLQQPLLAVTASSWYQRSTHSPTHASAQSIKTSATASVATSMSTTATASAVNQTVAVLQEPSGTGLTVLARPAAKSRSVLQVIQLATSFAQHQTALSATQPLLNST